MPSTLLEHPNGDVDDAIMRLIELKGGSPHADLLAEMIRTTLGLVDDGNGRGEIKILATSLQEMRASFRAFAPYAQVRKVSVFGSARTAPHRPEYDLARRFARRMAACRYMVITGAGGGIMQAANEGAGRAMSFGCHIRLPFEPANPVLEADPKLVNYKYFFTRKLTFVKETDGIALFPGGFGTLDECYEALTLVQTGKSDPLPVVCLDVPGGGYWTSFVRHFEAQLVARGLVSAEDAGLFLVTEDVEEAARAIVGFYRNYHSIRHVKERTVLRHVEPVSDALIEDLNREFADILAPGGRIERSASLPEEANEPALASLHRLVLPYDRRSQGRLRRLIDRLNAEAPLRMPEDAPDPGLTLVPISGHAR